MPKNVDYSRNHTYVEIVENSLTEELNETPEVKKVALTFDDGPHPIYTKEVLEVLRRRKIHATFFLIGEYAEVYPEIVKQIKEDGHVIGNHTYSHTVFQNDNLEDYLEECEKTSNLIEEITGEPTSYFRPPCGKSSKVLEKRLAMAQVLWTVDPLDWSIQNRGEIARKVMTQTKENDMILLHDEYETTVEALEDIIEGLEKRGFVFVTVDEIIMD